MNGVQLGMDDNGEVVEFQQDIETVPVEKVDYNSLTKAELIEIAEAQRLEIQTAKAEFDRANVAFGEQINGINDYYNELIKTKDLQLAYKDRKFKMILDIINLEGKIE